MKTIIIVLLSLLTVSVFGQSVLPLRADTVLIEKTGGSGELKIKNSTRDSMGLLVNIGGGRTRFIRAKMLNGTTIVVGLDTLTIDASGLVSAINGLSVSGGGR